jgi:restriction system protein
LNDLMTLGARMPWHIGIMAAVILFLVLHLVAVHFAPSSVSSIKPAELGPFLQRQFFSTIAGILQYVVPFAILIGVTVSFLRRSHSISLYRQTSIGGASTLDAMSSADFEMLVGEAFRRIGYTVQDNPTAGPDGGVDLVLRKGGETFLVQCKQWRTRTVGVSVVRELYGVVSARRAAGGFVVTTGRFTPDALAFAPGSAIEFIDGQRLTKMIKGLREADGSNPRFDRAPIDELGIRAVAEATPSCPRCGGTMVQRTARRGSNLGSQFWGCKGFPKCKGTIGS